MFANKQNIAYIFILSVLLMIPSALSPIFRKVFTDDILTGGASQWMPVLMALMLGVALFSAVVTWLQKSFLLKLSNRIEISKNAEYFWRLLLSPLRFFDKRESFALLAAMETSKKISGIITRDVIDILFSAVSVVFYFIMMLRLDVQMALVVVGLVLLNYLASLAKPLVLRLFPARPTAGLSAAELTSRERRLSSYGLQSIETFKSTASETAFFQRLMDNKSLLVNSRLPMDYKTAYSPVSGLPGTLFYNILLLISAVRIMNHGISIGTYLALQAYANAFFAPMSRVMKLRQTLNVFETHLAAMNGDFLTEQDGRSKDEPEHHAQDKDIPPLFHGNIEFDSVTFEYEKGRPVIENFSLYIPAGQRIAVIGPPGAGKTTLVKLLLGLYEPVSGRILIDGVDVRHMDRHTRALCIGCACQETAIFTASIRDNITLWDEDVTEVEVYRAASAACLHEYVTSLDDAYDCELHENGGNFSGGQRQLLEIARAFLRKPAIIVFDEAMRSVDIKTAAAIEGEIIRRGCTYIDITHILSGTVGYDEIIVMDKGKITGRGTHGELMRGSEYYASICQSEGGLLE